MDDFDFDFDEFAGFGDIDLGNIDLSSFNWDDVDLGSIADTIDLESMPDFGFDLSNIGDLGDIVITGQRGLDPFEVDEITSRDESDALWSSIDPYEIDGFQGSRDDLDALISSVDPYEIDGYQGSRDEDDILTPTKDDSCPPGSEKVHKYRDGSTMTLDCKGRVIGSTPATVNPDDPDSCPPGSETIETLADGSKVLKDCKGNVITTVKPDTKVIDNTKTTTPPPANNDFAKWAALLGGLLGLMNRPKGTDVATYKGSIPKYTATRGTPMSPTAGGRRPGAAGLGSLTGGVTYTKAAGGGLMGLAEGGKARPARYLRGGTDGMADKIQTDIDGKQPARLSHGEFVIPADVVSHLGNGNSDAGADVLYDMMAKVRKARTGTKKQGKQINPRKYTPA